MVMKLRFYQAECGDAARISFVGDSGKTHNIFIDSGYERTYRNILRDEINTLSDAEERIDLWILTHDHDDHIGGVHKYIRDIQSGFATHIVDEWCCVWMDSNSCEEMSKTDVSAAMSFAQGSFIRSYIHSVNGGENYMPIATREKCLDGMKLIFLSPTESSLKQIGKQHEKENEIRISRPMASSQNDYANQFMEFDLSSQEKDTNVINLCSIAFIAEKEGKKVLWLADSHAEIVVESLRALGYSEISKLCCDVVKMSHHGSDANCSDELLSLLDSTNYVISANGENIHNLPNKKCIARLLRNRHRGNKHYHIYFTHFNDTLASIFANEGPDIYERLNFSLHFPDGNDQWILF
jgi:beta-lactamase superfamily II metal-dependent hydrolase